mmetsp:Transcript_63615/g.110865  ORF Transcript_63615/g.110865 Transcript_63615/m.110865 type:complete len:139 (+) Transcript_63615:83-499(+)
MNDLRRMRLPKDMEELPCVPRSFVPWRDLDCEKYSGTCSTNSGSLSYQDNNSDTEEACFAELTDNSLPCSSSSSAVEHYEKCSEHGKAQRAKDFDYIEVGSSYEALYSDSAAAQVVALVPNMTSLSVASGSRPLIESL